MIKVKTFREVISIAQDSGLDKEIENFLAEQEGVVAFNISSHGVYVAPNKIINYVNVGYVISEEDTELEESEEGLDDASKEDEVTGDVPSGSTSDDDVIPF